MGLKEANEGGGRIPGECYIPCIYTAQTHLTSFLEHLNHFMNDPKRVAVLKWVVLAGGCNMSDFEPFYIVTMFI